MIYFLTSFSLLLLLNLSVFVISHDDSNFFNDIPPEMRCNGCLMTVNALTGMVHSSDDKSLEGRISKSINNVCVEKKLSISEYNPKVVTRVCKYLTKKYRQELFKEMMQHYNQMTHSTYLPLAHHVCQAVLRICPGPPRYPGDTDEAWVHIDEKTQDFKITPGKNIRMPRPVPENSRDEL